MAKTLPVVMVATVLDSYGVQAVTYVYALVDPTVSYATITGYFNAWLTYLDACLDGQILDAHMKVNPGLPSGLKLSPVALSSDTQGGILNFTATGTQNRWGNLLPGISQSSTVIANNQLVLTSGSPLYNYFQFLLTIGASALQWTNEDGQPLVSLRDSLIGFRKYKPQMAKVTFERWPPGS